MVIEKGLIILCLLAMLLVLGGCNESTSVVEEEVRQVADDVVTDVVTEEAKLHVTPTDTLQTEKEAQLQEISLWH